MSLMGKQILVAERHWKLARHAVSGRRRQFNFGLKGRRTFEVRFAGHFLRPFRTEVLSITVPGTLSLTNILRRFATAGSLNPQ
jgi:hypothetical protein